MLSCWDFLTAVYCINSATLEIKFDIEVTSDSESLLHNNFIFILLFQWNEEMTLEPSLNFPSQNEFERKEELYLKIIQYFQEGKVLT